MICAIVCTGSGNPALHAPVIYKYVAAAPGVMHQHVIMKLLARVNWHQVYPTHVFCMHFFDVLFLTFFISVFLLPFSGHLTFVFVERTSFSFLFLF